VSRNTRKSIGGFNAFETVGKEKGSEVGRNLKEKKGKGDGKDQDLCSGKSTLPGCDLTLPTSGEKRRWVKKKKNGKRVKPGGSFDEVKRMNRNLARQVGVRGEKKLRRKRKAGRGRDHLQMGWEETKKSRMMEEVI